MSSAKQAPGVNNNTLSGLISDQVTTEILSPELNTLPFLRPPFVSLENVFPEIYCTRNSSYFLLNFYRLLFDTIVGHMVMEIIALIKKSIG